MKLWHEYVLPTSVEDALLALTTANGATAVIAGGTDLLLDMQAGRHPCVERMIDISQVAEMQGIRQEQGSLYIGAAATHNEIIANPLLNQHAQCLIEACSLIGGPQVRNVATLGGNVAHALPAADGTIALAALNAEALVSARGQERWVPILDLFAGPGEPTFDRRSELLVGFRLPLQSGNERSVFQRITRPQGVAIAILNMAIALRQDAGRIADLRIACGPAGRTPFRALKTEALLRGQVWNDQVEAAALACLLTEAELRTSKHRATAEYRQHLLGVLLRRSMTLVWERVNS